jgi:hypothetical protein
MIGAGIAHSFPRKRRVIAFHEGISSPSPRLRGEGAFPQPQSRGKAPSPGAQKRTDPRSSRAQALSPQAGRGEDSVKRDCPPPKRGREK